MPPVNPHCHAIARTLAYRNVAGLTESPLVIDTLLFAEIRAFSEKLGAQWNQAAMVK